MDAWSCHRELRVFFCHITNCDLSGCRMQTDRSCVELCRLAVPEWDRLYTMRILYDGDGWRQVIRRWQLTASVPSGARGGVHGKTRSDVACGIYLKLGKLQSKARTTLVPGGGVNVDEDGNSVSWQATPENFLFHHSTLIRVYMAKLADHLRA